jgi:hypothetical protein
MRWSASLWPQAKNTAGWSRQLSTRSLRWLGASASLPRRPHPVQGNRSSPPWRRGPPGNAEPTARPAWWAPHGPRGREGCQQPDCLSSNVCRRGTVQCPPEAGDKQASSRSLKTCVLAAAPGICVRHVRTQTQWRGRVWPGEHPSETGPREAGTFESETIRNDGFGAPRRHGGSRRRSRRCWATVRPSAPDRAAASPGAGAGTGRVIPPPDLAPTSGSATTHPCCHEKFLAASVPEGRLDGRPPCTIVAASGEPIVGAPRGPLFVAVPAQRDG